jgi:nicotinate-nucleotide pyrophosphorylase (carboxylating)
MIDPRRSVIPPSDTLSQDEISATDALVGLALTEDLGEQGDITGNATIPSDAQGSAWIVSRQEGVVAGLPIVARLAARMGMGGGFIPSVADGTPIKPGSRVANVFGRMRTLLAFERTALNFLQHLSGIATLTARYVAEVAGTKAIILDTRKTLPGWRLLEKYAVRCGGGYNHRIGLFDAVLIKDNHLAWLEHCGDPIGASVGSARASTPAGTVVEVEVDHLEQLDRALASSPDIILLDNFDASMVSEAVRKRDALAPGIRLEASGGINLQTVRALAEAGIDRISVGAITHSAPALDLGLDFDAVVAG